EQPRDSGPALHRHEDDVQIAMQLAMLEPVVEYPDRRPGLDGPGRTREPIPVRHDRELPVPPAVKLGLVHRVATVKDAGRGTAAAKLADQPPHHRRLPRPPDPDVPHAHDRDPHPPYGEHPAVVQPPAKPDSASEQEFRRR